MSLRLPAGILPLLRCPACTGEPTERGDALVCGACEARFPIRGGLARLFAPHGAPLTERIRSFYEGTPFPGYEGLDSAASLRVRARANPFVRALDEQIPSGATVLEVGCGTGQLGNLLSMARRTVVGADMCLASLELAEGFRRSQGLARAGFVQMNLFRPCFAAASFDLVICSGVLHHTEDPAAGLASIATLVKPGGYLLVGLYHRWGRLGTALRRPLIRWGGQALWSLDPRLRDPALSAERREIWVRDQYDNPHESSHSIAQLRGWMEAEGLRWIRSLPGPRLFADPADELALFTPEASVHRAERRAAEWAQALSGSREGGLFLGIARRPTAR